MNPREVRLRCEQRKGQGGFSPGWWVLLCPVCCYGLGWPLPRKSLQLEAVVRHCS